MRNYSFMTQAVINSPVDTASDPFKSATFISASFVCFGDGSFLLLAGPAS